MLFIESFISLLTFVLIQANPHFSCPHDSPVCRFDTPPTLWGGSLWTVLIFERGMNADVFGLTAVGGFVHLSARDPSFCLSALVLYCLPFFPGQGDGRSGRRIERESWKETSLLANRMMPWDLWRSRSNIKWKVREPASWRREGRGHTSRERRRQEGTGMMGSRGSLMSFLLKPRKSFFLKSKGTGWIRRLGLTDTHYSI